jgi:hypothetical protein
VFGGLELRRYQVRRAAPAGTVWLSPDPGIVRQAGRWRTSHPSGEAATQQSSGQPESDQLKVLCMNNLLAATWERVFFKDRLSRFLFVSAGWIAAYALGATMKDLAGKTDFDVFSFAHAHAALQDEQQIIRTGRAIVGKVQRETFKGQPDVWVTTTKMPLRDERGQIVGTFGISRADQGTQRPHPAQ